MKKPVVIGISNRHVHLTDEHVEVLFGAGKKLTHMRDLKQTGQYACEEIVDIISEKGSIAKVRVLGPTRKQTQIEVSKTDAIKLKLNPPVRDSGDLKNSAPIKLRGPAGEIDVAEGTILAARHIHMSPQDAIDFGVKDKDHVKVIVGGERGLVFENVLIRVHPTFVLEMHIDTDEANACLVKNDEFIEVIN